MMDRRRRDPLRRGLLTPRAANTTGFGNEGIELSDPDSYILRGGVSTFFILQFGKLGELGDSCLRGVRDSWQLI